MAEALDALLVSQRFPDRLTEREGEGFRAVVPVDVQVAVAMHLKVEQPVERKLCKHVVEKANACVHIRLSGAVEIDKHPDFCLLGFALNRGGSCLIHTPSHLLVSVSLLPHLTAEA